MAFASQVVALLGGLVLGAAGCCLDVNGGNHDSSVGGTSAGLTTGDGSPSGSSSGGSTGGASTGGGSTGVVICFKDQFPLLHRQQASGCDGGQEGDGTDACFTDQDCLRADAGNRVCSCSPASFQPTIGPSVSANTCVPGNCSVDSDCPCGYCSPTLDEQCPNLWGVTGYYCHSAPDSCVNDSECPDGGLCVFGADAGLWTCTLNLCFTADSPNPPTGS